MPSYRTPTTDDQRSEMFQKTFDTSETVAPADHAIGADTKIALDAFNPLWIAARALVATTLSAQAGTTDPYELALDKTRVRVTNYFETLNRGIASLDINQTVRPLYFIALDDSTVPDMGTETQVILWAGRAIAGEASRVAAGGTAIGYPCTAAMIQSALTAQENLRAIHIPLKTAYDEAQEALNLMRPDADELLEDIRADVYHKFHKEPKPSFRRKARDWGLVFVTRPGELLTLVAIHNAISNLAGVSFAEEIDVLITNESDVDLIVGRGEAAGDPIVNGLTVEAHSHVTVNTVVLGEGDFLNVQNTDLVVDATITFRHV